MAAGRNLQAMNFVGMVGIMDPPRPGARESIETVRSAGVQVKMITGDAMETACSIGRLKVFNGNRFRFSSSFVPAG